MTMFTRILNPKRFNNSKGFTLIEIAIVLILIGIIIGAVIKGKDLIRSGEQKKIYTKYINAWRMSYASFYDRTGKRLGDFRNSAGLGQDGQCDTNHDGTEAVTVTERGYLITGDPGATPAYRGLDDLGLEPPVTNVSGIPYQYTYTDTDGAAHIMEISFRNDPTGNYNYMEIIRMPVELCMALDTMIDGEADGTQGDFRGDSNTGTAWTGAPADDKIARLRLQF